MSDLEPEHSSPDAQLEHALAHLDLPELDDAARWRLTLVLRLNGVPHQWRGTTLTLPAADVPIVVEALAGGDPLFDRPPPGGDRPLEIGPTASRPPRLLRTLGFLLDAIVYLVVGMSLGVFIYERRTVDAAGVTLSVSRPSVAACVIYAAIVLGYATVFVGRFGWTPGMAFTGVEVVDLDGRRLGWIRCFARGTLALAWIVIPPGLAAFGIPTRYLAAVQVVATLWGALVIATIEGDRHGRGFHDHLVGSTVRTTPPRRLSRQASAG